MASSWPIVCDISFVRRVCTRLLPIKSTKFSVSCTCAGWAVSGPRSFKLTVIELCETLFVSFGDGIEALLLLFGFSTGIEPQVWLPRVSHASPVWLEVWWPCSWSHRCHFWPWPRPTSYACTIFELPFLLSFSLQATIQFSNILCMNASYPSSFT